MSVPTTGFSALIKQEGSWWVGWIAEVPGVNCQETTRETLLISLRLTLVELLEMNRRDAVALGGAGFERVEIAP